MRRQRKTKSALWLEAFPGQKRRRPVWREYARAAAAFLSANPVCEACERRASAHVHHKRGRAGALRTDERFWIAVCFRCHRWIHDNPKHAMAHGWLCEAGEWNRPAQ